MMLVSRFIRQIGEQSMRMSHELRVMNTDYRKEVVFNEDESNTIEVS